MTTPNSQHQPRPNGSSEQATSTVLALDGWGPVIAEPSGNGVNGSELEAVVEPAAQVEAAQPRPMRANRAFADWQGDLAGMGIDPQLVRILAAVLAMAIAIAAVLKLGSVYQWREQWVRQWPARSSDAPTPAPTPSAVEALRRRAALAIDPSLTPVERKRRGPLDWIR